MLKTRNCLSMEEISQRWKTRDSNIELQQSNLGVLRRAGFLPLTLPYSAKSLWSSECPRTSRGLLRQYAASCYYTGFMRSQTSFHRSGPLTSKAIVEATAKAEVQVHFVGLFRGCAGILEKKMETSIEGVR